MADEEEELLDYDNNPSCTRIFSPANDLLRIFAVSTPCLHMRSESHLERPSSEPGHADPVETRRILFSLPLSDVSKNTGNFSKENCSSVAPNLAEDKGKAEYRNIGTGSRKSTVKCFKEKVGSVRMVVGEDIPITEISNLAGKMLVGRFNGKSPREKTLASWMEYQWKPLLGYSPTYISFPMDGFLSYF
jgi:hypothetical protein